MFTIWLFRVLLRIHIITGLSLLFIGCASQQKHDNNEQPKIGAVQFNSSDTGLVDAWDWAKETALSYAREDSSVGLWYEAALPGRDAFCMRDASHQAGGAAVLGMDRHTKNMLFRFAENISESKDWCSYWEINKDNMPAPVDYISDKDFWYNLPANFDVIDACFRMYLWTGDSSYIHDPVFLNFYEKSLTEYVDRWDLSADRIMNRNRIMNLPEGATSKNHHYYDKRGIPGYHERAGGKMQLGIDLLAAQYAANNWYHYYFHAEEESSRWLEEANKVDSIIRKVFWDPEKEAFRILLYEDGSWDYSVGNGQDFSHSLLHFKALEDPQMIESILNNYSRNKGSLIIELGSHLPDIFFKYGRPEDGIFMLKYLSDSTTHRREYPENPFSVTGAFVSGLMGINIDAPNNFISTFSGFTDAASWGLLEDLPYAGNMVTLLHQGRHTSVLTNHTQDTLYWQAFMEAGPDQWFLNHEARIYNGEVQDWYGTEIISWFMSIAPGNTISVSTYPNEKQYEE